LEPVVVVVVVVVAVMGRENPEKSLAPPESHVRRQNPIKHKIMGPL
jgi:hypothetical protein